MSSALGQWQDPLIESLSLEDSDTVVQSGINLPIIPLG